MTCSQPLKIRRARGTRVDANQRALAIELEPLPDGGAVIFPEATGHVPGVTGRLNPIRDTQNRTYLYASNIAINDGRAKTVSLRHRRGDAPHGCRGTGKTGAHRRGHRSVSARGVSACKSYLRKRPPPSREHISGLFWGWCHAGNSHSADAKRAAERHYADLLSTRVGPVGKWFGGRGMTVVIGMAGDAATRRDRHADEQRDLQRLRTLRVLARRDRYRRRWRVSKASPGHTSGRET